MKKPRSRSRQGTVTSCGKPAGAVMEKRVLPRTRRYGTHRRALVVEADPTTLRLCRDILEDMGFAVATADSGIAAVVATRNELPDFILMDLQLRDVPGREAVEWLRSNPALLSTPMIILTMSSDDDADVVAIRPSASMRKPVSPVAIRQAIRAVLG